MSFAFFVCKLFFAIQTIVLICKTIEATLSQGQGAQGQVHKALAF